MQAQASVDNTEDHEDSAEPDMDMADDSSLAMASKVSVMGESKKGLETHQRNNNCAHLGVGLLPPLQVTR